jgi:carboxyl-terminal processing protease
MERKMRFLKRASRPVAAALAAALLPLLSHSAQAFPQNAGSHFSPPSVTHQVFRYVDWKYVDAERARPENLLRGAFKSLETRYPEIVIDWNESTGDVAVSVDKEERRFTLEKEPSISASATLLEKIIAFAAPRLEGIADEELIRYMTLNGALSELDPHSNVFGQKHYKDFKVRTSGSFGGIGFTFGIREGELTIISPIPDTPGDRAGLRSEDRILFIDGEPTTNMSTDVAVSKMRGEPGSKVTLTIGREGWAEPKDFPIIREVIHIITVEKFILKGDEETPVLYLSVKNFQEDTASELRKAIRENDSDEIAGVIIDLRNNPGGLLSQAIEVSDGFLDEGVIVSTRGRDGKKYPRHASSTDTPFSLKPVVLLINRGSASASEIVAGALQNSRAIVLGRTSFGKGSVQQAYQLMDGGGLLLTVSSYLTPGDVSIQSIGIQPDMQVKPVEVVEGRLRFGANRPHVGEETLRNAFTEWGNATRKPGSLIRYLNEPTDPEEERRFKSPTPEEKKSALAGEFEVRLARRILGSLPDDSGVSRRDTLLDAASAVADDMAATEKKIIGQAFGQAGIDWTLQEEVNADPKLSVSFPDGFSLLAGSKTALELSVKNTGEAPVYQVWGTTDSDNPLLKNLDFAFGRIAPGEERSWKAEVEVPKSADSRWDPVTLKLTTAGDPEAGSYSGGARTRSIHLPAFAYVGILEDENSADPSRSGDGILDEGERLKLSVEVSNQGEAASDAVEVNLHADEKENFYLDKVRQKIESLAPGEKRTTELSFLLLKAKEDGEVDIRLTLSDREHGKFFSDTLTFQTGEPFARKQVRFPPRFTFADELPVRTDKETVVLNFSVSDDESVKDVYAYRGEKKISYVRNRKGGKDFSVTLEIPLEVGSNRISLFARDQKNISSQKTVYVHRVDRDTAYSEVIP